MKPSILLQQVKRLVIVAVLVLFAFSATAQNAHLKFKGIPIDGNYKEFAQKLIQKDFIQIESSDDGIVLLGNFMATPGVIVVVYPDPTSKVVSGVAAMIDAGNSWPSVESKYKDTVETYTEKYGAPTNHTEGFRGDIYSDFSRLVAIKEERCDYKATWELTEGKINIVPAYYGGSYYIVCAYVDGQNIEALRQTIIDDI